MSTLLAFALMRIGSYDFLTEIFLFQVNVGNDFIAQMNQRRIQRVGNVCAPKSSRKGLVLAMSARSEPFGIPWVLIWVTVDSLASYP